MNHRGFTVLETVLVVGLVAIILGVAVPLYRGYLADRALQNAAHLIQGDLRLTQQAAVSRAGSGPEVEMCFSSTGYEVYAVNYVNAVDRTGAQPASATLKTAVAGEEYRAGISVSPAVTATDSCLRYPSDATRRAIVFSGAGAPISFGTAAPQDISLTLNGRTRRVTVAPNTGRVTVGQ